MKYNLVNIIKSSTVIIFFNQTVSYFVNILKWFTLKFVV